MSLPSEVVFGPKISIQAITDIGKSRTHNEDNFIVCPDLGEKRWCLSDGPASLSPKGCLLVVADGMGGANAGEIASEIAVETIRQKFDSFEIEEGIEDSKIQDCLYTAIIAAHKAIVAASDQNPSCAGMGTTILIAWVLPHKVVLAWVGDSRAYLYSKQQGLKILTSDHSLVWELVEAGKLTPEEADVHPDSNIITQSLGDKDHPPQPDFTTCLLKQGDRLLLCSDGLNNMVTHKAIEKILGEGTPLPDACQKLVYSANQEGGADNITVLSLEVMEAPGEPAEKKPFNLLGLLTVLACCLFLGWLLFSAPGFSEPASATSGGKQEAPEQVSPAAEPVLRPQAAASPSVADDSPVIPIHAVSPLASELTFALAKYNYLDSIVSLRFPAEELERTGQSGSVPAQEAKDSSPQPGQEQVKHELMGLVKKYRLGYSEGDSAQQYFLNSLPGKDELVIGEISRELSRIEVLINQVKPQ